MLTLKVLFLFENISPKKSEVFVHVMEVVQDFGTIFGIFFSKKILWERELFKSGYKIVICLYFIETLINTRQSVIIQLERKVLKSGFKTDPRSLWIWYRSDFLQIIDQLNIHQRRCCTSTPNLSRIINEILDVWGEYFKRPTGRNSIIEWTFMVF